jgi:hypothetical protein
VQQAVLDRHVVPPEGADAFARKDFDLFFHLRLQALNALESEFARRVGILREPA